MGDISYIESKQGWLYLAVVIDLYSRMVVGWAVAETMEASLIIQAMENAVKLRRPSKGLIFHSDRGSQYASGAFQKLLRQKQIIPSMSRKGNCWDNAVSESFFHTLKGEHLAFTLLQNQKQAQASLFDYIERFYNRKRLHSTIGYLSPNAFEQLKGEAA